MYQNLFKEGNTQTLNKINKDRDPSKYPFFNKTKREVEQATNFLPNDVDFNARIYCIENEIHEHPKCKVCNTPITWNKTHKRFADYCSKKCINSSKSIRSKMDKTKKENNSYIKSDNEEEAYDYLKEIFGEVKRQYKDIVRYPFNCDFYVPHLDLFIEINVNWTHGDEPYNPSNVLHQIKLDDWTRKAKNSDFFRNAIRVWTEYDVKKFYYAEVNQLNFVAIYNWNDKNDFLWKVIEALKESNIKKGFTLNSSYSIEEMSKEIKLIESKKGDITSSPLYNKTVITFQPTFYSKEKELYQNPDIRDKIIKNREYYLNKKKEELTDREILSGFKKSGIHYGYSHFSPLWGKYFIEKYNVNSIYDPCGGWGHRLLGAWSIDYIYNDADKNVKNGVQNIWKYLKNNKSLKLFYNKDASNFTPNKLYDAVFTCPPYYNHEIYYGKKDSLKLYPDYQDWLHKWWYNVVKHSLKNAKYYFAFVINEKLKEDMKKECEKFDIGIIEEVKVGPNKKSHFQTKKGKRNQDWLVVYKRNNPIKENKGIRCELCKRNMKSLKGLKKHLSMAHPEIDRKEYYNAYLKPENESSQCPYCGKEKGFFDKGMFYWSTCGDKECVAKLNSEKVSEHHNSYTQEEWDEIIEKRKQTNLKKYGTEWAIQSEQVKETRRQNNIEKFGVENNSQTQEWKDRVVGKKRPNYNKHN